MRVIAGEYRGRRLVAPEGRATRPTTDRVRESLMSSIVSARGGLEGAVVLDAFAGSGAFGVECLSRGAAWALLSDKDPAAVAAARRNASFVDRSRVRVVRCDVAKRVPDAGGRKFDLVFFDPPYAMPADDVMGVLASLAASGELAEGCLVAYEHAEADDASAAAALERLHCVPVRHKAYRGTSIELFRTPAER